MKTRAYALVALVLALSLAGCVTAQIDENGVSAVVAPLASLPRVKQAEANQQAWNEGMEGAVTSIAQKVDDEAAKAAVAAAAAQKKIDDSIIELQDEAQVDWLELALIALGVGGAGTGGLAYRKKLLNTKPPAKKKAS